MTIDCGNDMQFVLERVSSRCLHRRLSAELLYKVCKEPEFHCLSVFSRLALSDGVTSILEPAVLSLKNLS